MGAKQLPEAVVSAKLKTREVTIHRNGHKVVTSGRTILHNT